MDRGTWQAAVHGVTKESDMTEQLSIHVCVYEYNTYKIKSDSQMREVGRMTRMTLLWFPTPTQNHIKSLSVLTVSLGFG